MSSKTPQSETARSRQNTGAGPEGTALSPPPYGIDFVDRQVERQNRTGLPDRLKAGIEHLSGLPMNDVRGDQQRAQTATAVQRTLGNARLARLFSGGGGPQAQLTVGPPNDRFEQEAEQVARRVVAGERVARIPRLTAGGLQPTTDLESAINRARGGGQPLDAGLQRSMGQAMGADFSGVRVHTDSQSDQLNQSIQAKAFTTGQDVFFREVAYEPGSRGGQELIAHELTHVMQQNGGAVQRSPLPSQLLPQHPATETPSAMVGERAIHEEGETVGQRHDPSVAQRPNRTGLPDHLKTGIESLSGMSLDNVRVHYNSAQPAQLNALAYAQGSDIHVAPGQEQHLPHEAWHIVQQAQGRVRPTMQMKDGVPVNDDERLEHEADVMGGEAAQMRGKKIVLRSADLRPVGLQAGQSKDTEASCRPIQLARYPASARGRVTKPPFETAIKELDYIVRPRYRDSDIPGAGGMCSTATLGPTGSWLGQDSDANAEMPGYIRAAREKYPGSHLKAGHLLNACFGGDGNAPTNLTILSATGNANHKAFDEPVKRAVELLKKAYLVLWKADIDVTTAGVGVAVSINVNVNAPWPGETAIFSGLNCIACVTDTTAILGDFQDDRLKQSFLDIMKEIEGWCIDATSAGEEVKNPR